MAGGAKAERFHEIAEVSRGLFGEKTGAECRRAAPNLHGFDKRDLDAGCGKGIRRCAASQAASHDGDSRFGLVALTRIIGNA
jgi:hypothetical protein